MKRILEWVLITILSLSMSGCASQGDEHIERLNSIDDFDTIYAFHEGIAVARKGVLFGYVDDQGNVLAQPVFAYATHFSQGTANVIEGEIEEEDESGKLYMTNMAWRTIDASMRFTNETRWDSLTTKFETDRMIGIRDSRQFLLYGNGNELASIDAELSRWEDGRIFHSGVALIRNIGTKKLGIMDMEGKLIETTVLEKVYEFDRDSTTDEWGSPTFPSRVRTSAGVTAARTEAGDVLIDSKGDYIYEPGQYQYKALRNGILLYKTDEGWGILNAEGKPISDAIYYEIDVVNEHVLRATYGEMGFDNTDYYIPETMERYSILNMRAMDSGFHRNGKEYIAYASESDPNCVMVEIGADAVNVFELPGGFDKELTLDLAVKSGQEDRLRYIIVRDDGGYSSRKLGIASITGEMLTDIEWSSVQYDSNTGGILLTKEEDHAPIELAFLWPDGQLSTPISGYACVTHYEQKDRIFAIEDIRQDEESPLGVIMECRLYDMDGKPLSERFAGFFGSFHNGVAPIVRHGAHDIEFIDTTGNMVAGKTVSIQNGFFLGSTGGYMVVMEGSALEDAKIKVIDYDGNSYEIDPTSKMSSIVEQGEEMLCVVQNEEMSIWSDAGVETLHLLSTNGENERIGIFEDQNGHKITMYWDNAMDMGAMNMLMGLPGRTRRIPGQWDDIGQAVMDSNWVPAYFPVCREGKWGLVNLNGEIVVPLVYEAAEFAYARHSWAQGSMNLVSELLFDGGSEIETLLKSSDKPAIHVSDAEYITVYSVDGELLYKVPKYNGYLETRNYYPISSSYMLVEGYSDYWNTSAWSVVAFDGRVVIPPKDGNELIHYSDGVFECVTNDFGRYYYSEQGELLGPPLKYAQDLRGGSSGRLDLQGEYDVILLEG